MHRSSQRLVQEPLVRERQRLVWETMRLEPALVRLVLVPQQASALVAELSRQRE
jgi:hypothetical protein